MSFASPHFLTLGNFRAMLMCFSIEGIVVVGMTILLIVGGIDLSVGSVVCFSMVLSGSLFLAGLDPVDGILIGIGASALIGAAMGFFVTVDRAQSLHHLACGDGHRARHLPDHHQGHAAVAVHFAAGVQGGRAGHFYGIPYVILIFVAWSCHLRLPAAPGHRLPQGVLHRLQREGGALFSGIKTNQVKFWVTVLCSTLAGLAGVIYMSRFGAATPTFGVGMELNIIAAAVIGGASLNGGSGTIFGAILGMALLSVVTSSLILLDVSVYWQDMIKGCILLAAVSIDHFLHKRKS